MVNISSRYREVSLNLTMRSNPLDFKVYLFLTNHNNGIEKNYIYTIEINISCQCV